MSLSADLTIFIITVLLTVFFTLVISASISDGKAKHIERKKAQRKKSIILSSNI